ncbi:spiro-SPASM protein [Treponema bryantii]|uniref:Spiro-SPASM protein n=2 Tax=Treponema bryantii TaxID=163 RepID=A0A1H9AGA7_9SPIR|nr:spiro-SPASM protein [Treponema bryantii]
MPIKNLMKTIVIFYDNDSSYSKEKAFNGKSAEELSKNWAESLGLPSFTVKSETLTQLLCEMKELCTKENAETAVFSFIDLPFLDKKLSQKIIDSHITYKSEYTFADGYPYGFSPEALNAGTIGILAELSKTTQVSLGEQPVSREGLYNLIKTDINSFDVETVIADSDWRLLRLSFHCGKKDNFMQCKALFDAASKEDFDDVEKLSAIASKNTACLKTVPGFYNIQIADKVAFDSIYSPYCKAYGEKFGSSPLSLSSDTFMAFDKITSLIDKIAGFSENAVIGLSAWGEPLNHPDFLKIVEKILSYQGLSVFLETDGLSVTSELCQKLSEIVNKAAPRTHQWQKIMLAVTLDAASDATYQKIHKNASEGAFAAAVNAVSLLQNAIPGCVYPQFVRMNENEAELEAFFRYWNEKTNPSGGNLIIQKYDDFAGLLPDCKPADLSPLDRDPCWHLRRDLTILSNGEVPQCRACVLCGKNGNSLGNVFTDSLEEIWKKNDELLINHINKKYCNKCEKCDEWYTFNF